jgi:hypothetical protein
VQHKYGTTNDDGRAAYISFPWKDKRRWRRDVGVGQVVEVKSGWNEETILAGRFGGMVGAAG